MSTLPGYVAANPRFPDGRGVHTGGATELITAWLVTRSQPNQGVLS